MTKLYTGWFKASAVSALTAFSGMVGSAGAQQQTQKLEPSPFLAALRPPSSSFKHASAKPPSDEVTANQTPNIDTLPEGPFRMDVYKKDGETYITADVERGDNYVIFNMHDPSNDDADIFGLLELSMALRDYASEGREPIIISDLGYEVTRGQPNKDSKSQEFTLRKALETIAPTSERPIVLINAVVLRMDDIGSPTYLGHLIASLKRNNGLKNGEHLDMEGEVVAPYCSYHDALGNVVWGGAWSGYTSKEDDPENGLTNNEIAGQYFGYLRRLVKNSNEALLASKPDQPRPDALTLAGD